MTCYGINLYILLRKQYSDFWISPLSLGTELPPSLNIKLKHFWIIIEFFFYFIDFIASDIKGLDIKKAKKEKIKKKKKKNE